MRINLLAFITINNQHSTYPKITGISDSVHNNVRSVTFLSASDPNPNFDTFYNSQPVSRPQINNKEQEQQQDPNTSNDVESVNKGNRWSKFAPDTNLPIDEFRTQLRDNMKTDLERRRKEDPNRGNQPAKNYLDNL